MALLDQGKCRKPCVRSSTIEQLALIALSRAVDEAGAVWRSQKLQDFGWRANVLGCPADPAVQQLLRQIQLQTAELEEVTLEANCRPLNACLLLQCFCTASLLTGLCIDRSQNTTGHGGQMENMTIHPCRQVALDCSMLCMSIAASCSLNVEADGKLSKRYRANDEGLQVLGITRPFSSI